jgi:hypothetical protein
MISIKDDSKLAKIEIPFFTKPTRSAKVIAPVELSIPSITLTTLSNNPAPATTMPTEQTQHVWEIPAIIISAGITTTATICTVTALVFPEFTTFACVVTSPLVIIPLCIYFLFLVLLREIVKAWAILILAVSYPAFIMMGVVAPLLVYILLFHALVTWGFWHQHRDVWFTLIVFSWIGVLSGVGWTFLTVGIRPQVSIAIAFILLALMIVTRDMGVLRVSIYLHHV